MVPFASPTSPVAICTYCRSTVVRDGEALKKVGVSAALITDRTPLKLGVTGRYGGKGFTLVGRQQFSYGGQFGKPAGSWNEWHALFDDGSSGWLSEDNDKFVFSFDRNKTEALPAAGSIRTGGTARVAGGNWQVASLTIATLAAAEGELPSAPPLGRTYAIADLRNAQDQVATLDYADKSQPVLSIGEAVRLADLALQGLAMHAEDGTATVGSRQFACPECGSDVKVELAGTLSVTCASCRSVIDVSNGIGGELKAWRQQRPVSLRIPLASSGTISVAGGPAVDWQVVGFQRKRSDHSDFSERFSWSEYLLYNRSEGFAFLVDSMEGWVGFRTLTGAPARVGAQTLSVEWQGGKYRRTDGYGASVEYVEGEFYWKVEKDQKSQLEDYEGMGTRVRERLSRETGDGETIWSRGSILPYTYLQRAFGLAALATPTSALDSDVGPSSDGELNWPSILFIIVIIILLQIADCSDGDNDYHGGGYSSMGGGHK